MQRIIDISSPDIFLNIQNGMLAIGHRSAKKTVTVPLLEILCVVVSSNSCTITHAVLAQLADNGIPFISCNTSFLPTGLMIPFKANALQGERFWKQRDFLDHAGLWKNIILAKIQNTVQILTLWGRSAPALQEVIFKLSRGEMTTEAAESFSARVNFEALFETGFTRRDNGHPENARLNYGYTILRSCVARFICAAGLHPTFGIHHKNKYNAFALADDLMEPFRPFVDHLVMELTDGVDLELELTPEDKSHLAGGMFERWKCGNETRTLVDWIERTVRSCAQYIFQERRDFPAFPIVQKPENFHVVTDTTALEE